MKNALGAMLLLAGLALAGSDGEYFPVTNLIGLGLILAAAILTTERKHYAQL